MFSKIKALIQSRTGSVEDVENFNDLATKGMKLNNLVTLNYPLLSINQELSFDLGYKTKKVTGISSSEERGDCTHRFYTEDDFFYQVDFFGEDKVDNLARLSLFHYLLNEGEELDPTDEESLAKWRKIIEEDEIFTFNGNEYRRSSGVLGGLEVVEVIGDDLNTIENTFAVFEREINSKISEYIIVNVEEEVLVNDDDEVTGRGDMTATLALGVNVPHSQIDINRTEG
ncbi:DUF2491 family protein [Vibrio crassostreae]|uniref:DUF2491 family protein n=1 Tax=Vibrio crassostreae TaxID=246167 RepID=UPI001B30728F|nr:DUF2491 family protein [Vibrio crassostreae]